MARAFLLKIQRATIGKKKMENKKGSIMKTQSKVIRAFEKGLKTMVPYEVTRSRKVWARISTSHMIKKDRNFLILEILTKSHANKRENGTARKRELVR